MELTEAQQILSKNGYIVENADTISFEQEAKNIVYSYGTDEYGLDVDQIVKSWKTQVNLNMLMKEQTLFTNNLQI